MNLPNSAFQSTPLDRSEIQQAALDIEAKSRSNPLTWKGQFSPQLVQALLERYATPGLTVFDPFLGSGTVLYEAGRANLSAVGTEINPAAYTLARLYQFMNVSPEQRRRYTDQISGLLRQAFPLWPGKDTGSRPDFEAKILELALRNEAESYHILLEALITRLDFYQQDLSAEKIASNWYTLKQFVFDLPFSQNEIKVFQADARQTSLADHQVDLVVTSPPYVNVFNYHQQYRKSMEALAWNILDIARSEIGANRKHRGNRFLTVIQFCLDMAQVFQEIRRVSRPEARVIVIVGRESMVRGTRFFNGEIVAEVAVRALGFELSLRQERVFQNRFGNRIIEDILHFSLPKDQGGPSYLNQARSVAAEVLAAVCGDAEADVKKDLTAALQEIEAVEPSPLFDPSNARKIAEYHPRARA